jgi:hypothetical protein
VGPVKETMMLSWLLSLGTVPLLAAQHASHESDAPRPGARTPDLIRGPDASLSSFPTPAFDAGGRLWLAFVEGNRIYVSSSGDLGRSFTPAVAVTSEEERIDANGEGRPKIAFGKDGAILVTWTQKVDEPGKPYSGLIRFARSADRGRSFSRPITLNDDGLATGHRFDALAVAPSGAVLVAWIDKRDLERALSRGESYAGASVYLARSEDSGRSFEANRKIQDNVCECCRLAFAFDARGEASLLLRGVLDGGIRDHVLLRSAATPEEAHASRVTFDDWKIDACPHHGPSLWIDEADRYHIAWFTAGERSGTGVFYARSSDGGRTFERAVAVSGASAAHPFVVGSRGTLHLVWMEVDGRDRLIRYQRSRDSGGRWSSPATIARGAAGADHPLLVKKDEEVFLSWFTKDAGYRLIALPENGAPGE